MTGQSIYLCHHGAETYDVAARACFTEDGRLVVTGDAGELERRCSLLLKHLAQKRVEEVKSGKVEELKS